MNSFCSRGVFRTSVGLALLLATLPAATYAAPVLTLRGTSNGLSSASITPGTATFSLDLRLNSDGHAVNSVTYTLTANSAVNYAGTPLTLGTPFVAPDVLLQPSDGSQVLAANGTAFARSAAGDYTAASFTGSSAMASYLIDTHALTPGTTIIFTPVGIDQADTAAVLSGTPIETFGTPGTFTLTVATPEPAGLTLAALAGGLLVRRKRHAGR